jgi:hypothetical protein
MSTLKATNIKNESSASNNIVLDSGGGVVVSGVTTVTAGSASAPAISFNDSNTGLYSPGADQLALSTGGVGRVFVDASGRFGVGTASPGYALDVKTSAETACRLDSGSGYNAILRFAQAGVNKAFIQYPNGGGLTFGPAGSEAARLDSSGRLLVGTSTARTNLFGTSSSMLQLENLGNSNIQSGLSCISGRETSTSGGTLVLGHHRTGSVGGNTSLGNNDLTGLISFQGADGTNLVQAATIEAYVDGTPGTNDMPGRLVFSTTADGASSPTERLRIDRSGTISLGNLVTPANANIHLDLYCNSSYDAFIRFRDESGAPGLIGFDHGSNTMQFYTNGASEAMRIDASGRLLVGTSTTRALGTYGEQHPLQIEAGDAGNWPAINITWNRSGDGLGPRFNFGRSRSASNGGVTVVQNGDSLGSFHFYGADGTDLLSAAASIGCAVDGTPGNDDMPGRLVFSTTADGASGPTERMRIRSNGRVLINSNGNNPSNTQTGTEINEFGYIFSSTNAEASAYFNRNTNDGTIVEFRQDNTGEGTISISGTTVSYNGAHLSRWSQLLGGAERTDILRGSVLSNLDEMCEWGEEENEQLNRMKVSDVEGDKNVSGVFQVWDDDDDTYTNDFYCAMTGDFVIRIAAGTTVERGDLLMSAGDGTAKPQDDDIIRSKTIAKVTSINVSCTYDDGSYCVPCVLMAC